MKTLGATNGTLGLLLGGLLAISHRCETRRYLSVVGVASCNLIMRPSMIFVGTLIAALSLASLALAWRAHEKY